MKYVACILLWLASFTLHAKTLHVWSEGSHVSPFNSWATAATNLQDAVNDAVSDDTLLVAPGVYTAPASAGNVVHIDASVHLAQGTTLTLRAALPPGGNPDDVPVIDGQGVNRGILVDGFVDAWIDRGLVIDGFHIINGHAEERGGAIRSGGAAHLHLQLLNCTITNNTADISGGGLFASSGPRPVFVTISNCVFRFNHADSNSGDDGGGAIYLTNANDLDPLSWTIRNSVLSDNTTNRRGGGLKTRHLQDGSLHVENVLFARNRAADGGAYHHEGISGGSETKALNFVNTTFAQNQSTNENGIVQMRYGGGSLSGYNLIFHGNQNADYLNRNITGSVLSPDYVVYSRLDTPDLTRYPDASNITLQPAFEAPEQGDFRLMATSPCVNVGTNFAWMATAVDLDGKPRLDRIHAKVDMGCYEYHYQGSILLVR